MACQVIFVRACLAAYFAREGQIDRIPARLRSQMLVFVVQVCFAPCDAVGAVRAFPFRAARTLRDSNIRSSRREIFSSRMWHGWQAITMFNLSIINSGCVIARSTWCAWRYSCGLFPSAFPHSSHRDPLLIFMRRKKTRSFRGRRRPCGGKFSIGSSLIASR